MRGGPLISHVDQQPSAVFYVLSLFPLVADTDGRPCLFSLVPEVRVCEGAFQKSLLERDSIFDFIDPPTQNKPRTGGE